MTTQTQSNMFAHSKEWYKTTDMKVFAEQVERVCDVPALQKAADHVFDNAKTNLRALIGGNDLSAKDDSIQSKLEALKTRFSEYLKGKGTSEEVKKIFKEYSGQLNLLKNREQQLIKQQSPSPASSKL